jgi:pimeloyl-ACP methyl ester carboxylesterase
MTSTRFAHRANARLAYDPGDAIGGPSRPALLALHDLLGDRATYLPLADVLGSSHRIIRPDTRGHGASASLANRWYTISELAMDAEAILAAEQIDRCVIIGHGIGGTTAIEMALRSPSTCHAIVLLDPELQNLFDNDADPAARRRREELRTSDRAAADASYKGLTDQALAGYLGPRWGSDWQVGILPARRAAIRRHAGSLAALLPALDSYNVDKAGLRALSIPVLILVTTSEAGTGEMLGERLLAYLPTARLVGLDEPRGPLASERIVEEIEAFVRSLDT